MIKIPMVEQLLTIIKSNKKILNFCLVIFLSFAVFYLNSNITFADLVVGSNISISAIVGNNNPGNDTNNGAGGGGSTPFPSTIFSPFVNPAITPTDITFSGIAYPNAKVFLLSSGQEAIKKNADLNGLFSLKLSNLTSGIKVFSVVAEDIRGVRSVLVTIPINIKDSTSTTVANLFIPPTLSIDKNLYSIGESILVHGYGAPRSTIVFSIDSQNNFTTIADNSGSYNFAIKTDSFSLGDHDINVKAQNVSGTQTKSSGLGKLVSFTIALNDQPGIPDNQDVGPLIDINNGAVISIADFSILASYYGKPSAPKGVDLNGDGKVDMKDFSILAYYWNG